MTDSLVQASEDLLETVLKSAAEHMDEDQCKKLGTRSRARIQQLKMLNSANRKKLVQLLKRDIGSSFGKEMADINDLQNFVQTASANSILNLLKIQGNLHNSVVNEDVRKSLERLITVLD